MNGGAGSSDDSSTSAYSSQQSKTSVTDAVAAHSENCATDINLPEVPTCCCMSGCANCVYIQYAMEMTDYFKDNGTSALKAIDAIEDEGVKTFLKMEIEHIILKQR